MLYPGNVQWDRFSISLQCTAKWIYKMQSNEVDLTTEATDLIVHDADIYFDLSHDFSVIRFITSCHRNRMTTRVITLWRV